MTADTSSRDPSQSDVEHNDTAQKLATLADITEQLRQLQEQLVSHDISLKDLQLLQQSLSTSQQSLQAYQPHELANHLLSRPIAHFNFPAGPDNPNAILPYSPVTGRYNAIAPNIDVQFDKASKQITATVTCGRRFEGPPTCLHGGIIAAIYDQILAMCASCNLLAGPTANLSIDYLAPTPLFQELSFTARIDKVEGRKVFIIGECFADQLLCSRAQGLFIHYQGDA